jgi:hypothetical protein
VVIEKLKLKRNIGRFIFIFFFLGVSFLLSRETGRLSLTYQNQIYKTFAQNAEYYSTLNSLYLNFWQDLTNWGSMDFSINYYFNRDLRQVASYNLGIQDIPLGKFRMDADFGYTSYPLSSLRHFGSFNPANYRGLKGGKISLRSKKTDLFVFGGQIYGSFGYGSDESSVYGARAVFRPNRRWTLGTGWLKIMDLPLRSPVDNFADYDIFSLDTSWRLKKNLYFLSDFRYVFNTGKKSENGFFIKTGTYYSSENLSFEMFYNYISPDFPYLGNIFIQDYKGITVVGQYRPVSWLSLFGSLDTFNRHLEYILENSFSDYMTYRLGTIVSPRIFPQFSFSFNKSKKEIGTEGSGNSNVGSGTDFDMIFLSLSKHHKRFYWSFYYNIGEFNNVSDVSNNYTLSRFYLNIRRSYPAGHVIYLNGYLDKRTGHSLAFKYKNLNLQLGGNLLLSSRFMLNAQFGYSVDEDVINREKNRQLGFGGSINYRFKPLAINCALRYQYSKIKASLTNGPLKYSHQFFFSITKDLRWGRGTEGIGLAGILSRRGKIKGCVFVDLNQNDRKDPGEEGLEGIYILLDRKKTAKTGKDGNFTLKSVPVGDHQISFDLRNIPAFYEAAREKSKLVIKKGETKEVFLTVIPVGLLSGRLFLDKNENNRVDKDEPILAGLQINLYKDDRLYRWEFTNSKGVFTFDNLRPGTYIIKVDDEGIKEKYTGIEKSSMQVTIKPWEEARGLILLVRQYKKTRIKKILE